MGPMGGTTNEGNHCEHGELPRRCGRRPVSPDRSWVAQHGLAGASRDLHNATAGNPDGVAVAKSLGDLSHNVYLPASDGDERLLFLDT
jgi:hypothetical protein